MTQDEKEKYLRQIRALRAEGMLAQPELPCDLCDLTLIGEEAFRDH
jgi:hypothetical protein